EVDHPSKATKDYVSGQVPKPNPAHAEIAAQLAKSKSDLAAATAAATKIQPSLTQAETALRNFDTQVAELEKKHSEAQSLADQADSQLAAAKQHRDDLEGQLETAKSSGTPTGGIETQLTQTDAAVAQWAKAVLTRRDAEDDARKKLEATTAARQPAVDARDRL